MTTRPIFVFMLLSTLAFAMVVESSLSSHFGHSASNVFVRTGGSIGETLGDEEMIMPSESARRALADARHISYNAMSANAIPCNNRGQSYYACNRMEQARPYRRGCSRITNCARG